MGNRAVQAGLVVVFLIFGVVAAYALNSGRKSNNGPTASASPSVAVSPSEAASPSPTASPSPSEAPSPTAAPSESPTAAPTQAPQPTGTAASGCSTAGSGGTGPASYPRQLWAGASYSYCGPRVLVVHATSAEDRGLTSVCAGINEATQGFPAGYRGVFFVGVVFKDGQIVSAGYIRDSAGANRDFASIQNGNGSNQRGALGSAPGSGSHRYCVKRVGAQWVMTRDDQTLYQTSDEPAVDLAGATLKFDNDAQPVGSPAAQQFTFTVPGFHDIGVGDQPPRQLRGATFYS